MRKHSTYSTLLFAFLVVAVSCHAECKAGGEGEGVAGGEGGEEAVGDAEPGEGEPGEAIETEGQGETETGEPSEGGEAGDTGETTQPVGLAQNRANHNPVTCAGQEEVTVENAVIRVPDGTAIRASGQCEVILVNVVIEAKVAIDVSGQAEVTIRNSQITGTDKAVRAAGQAKVTAVGSQVTGGATTTGQAQVTGIQ